MLVSHVRREASKETTQARASSTGFIISAVARWAACSKRLKLSFLLPPRFFSSSYLKSPPVFLTAVPHPRAPSPTHSPPPPGFWPLQLFRPPAHDLNRPSPAPAGGTSRGVPTLTSAPTPAFGFLGAGFLSGSFSADSVPDDVLASLGEDGVVKQVWCSGGVFVGPVSLSVGLSVFFAAGNAACDSCPWRT